MEPYVLEWLNLLVRVAHVLAAIMWIGDSFLFMFLDSHLVKPTKAREGDVVGELWMTHSGGFYEVVKRKSLLPAELPATLHWFKWESYSTFITGFFLLTVVYWLGGQATLAPVDGRLTHGQAVGVSLGLLIAGVGLYHHLCMIKPLIERPRVFGIIALVAIAGGAYGLSFLFTPRAVFLQLGAMLGTIMSSNVLFRIIPAQRHMLAATQAGLPVDTSYGLRAKQRSIHNHYLTLPVLFMMLSNHLPAVYGHPYAWLVLALVSLVLVGVKHIMNTRRQTSPAVVAATVAALAVVVGLTTPRGATAGLDPALADRPPVSFATVRQILDARCVTCHARHPSNPAFPFAAPGGVELEAPGDVKAHAPRVLVRACATKTMPLGNLTGMTQEERDLLGAWILQGADVDAAGPSVVDAQAPGSSTPTGTGADAVFAQRCALCHGPGGKGDGVAAATLDPKPRQFTDKAWQASITDDAIAQTIVKGGAAMGKSSAMPPHADLEADPAALRALVEHIRNLGK